MDMDMEIEDIKKDIHKHFYLLVKDYAAGGDNLKAINDSDYDAIQFVTNLSPYFKDKSVYGQVLKMISVYYILSSFFLLANGVNHQMTEALKELPTEDNEIRIERYRTLLQYAQDSVLKSNSFGYVKKYAEDNGHKDPTPSVNFTSARLAPIND